MNDANRDLSHLHPDQLRVGAIGVFAGDWAWRDDDSPHPYIPTGFVGILTGDWNGWAVYACTRTVAEAIVADQQQDRTTHQNRLTRHGATADEAEREVNATWPRLTWDGDDIIADSRAVTGDEDDLLRMSPDVDGRYTVMGGTWTWTAVPPQACRRIVGTIPTPHDRHVFVPLKHSNVRVPHDRIAVTALDHHPDGSSTAILSLAGAPVAVVVTHPGASTTASSTHPDAGPAIRHFVASSRRDGRVATAREVLNALVDEFDVNRIVAAATRRGGTIARLLTDDARTVALHAVTAWPATREDHTALSRELTNRYPHTTDCHWDIWNGHTWLLLAPHQP